MPYQTTLKPRTRAITHADLKALEHIHIDEDAVTKVLERWNGEYGLPFLPQDLEELFKGAFDKALKLIITDHGQENLDFSVYDGDVRLTRQIYCPRLKKREGNDIQLGKLQGQKLGTQIFRMFVELDIALGFSETTFLASKNNGGYVWARMGFSLDSGYSNADIEIRKLSDRILARLEALESFIPVNIYQEAKKLAKLEKVDDICRLAALDFDIRHCFSEEDCGVKQGFIRKRLRDTFDSKVSIDAFESLHLSRKATDSMRAVMANAMTKDRPATLGMLLLTGETWQARADLDNPLQLKKIGEYGGGMAVTRFVSGLQVQPQALQCLK